MANWWALSLTASGTDCLTMALLPSLATVRKRWTCEKDYSLPNLLEETELPQKLQPDYCINIDL